MIALLDAALRYLPRTVPLRPRGKRPAVDAWPDWPATRETVTAWWTTVPQANVGLRTGRGLVAIDVDPRAGGHDLLADLEHEHGELPATVTARTGGADGGRHLYFRAPADLPSYDIGTGLEVKAAGRQVVAPPSVHPDTGALYEWEHGRAPGEIRLATLPAWAYAGHHGTRKNATPASGWLALLRPPIADGERNTALTRLAGHLLAKRVDPHVAAELVRAVNQCRCKPPLPDREVQQLLDSIAAREQRKRGWTR